MLIPWQVNVEPPAAMAIDRASAGPSIEGLLDQAKELYEAQADDQARQLYSQILTLARELDDKLAIATAQYYLARIDFHGDRHDVALSGYLDVLETLSTIGSANDGIFEVKNIEADTNFHIAEIYASILDDSGAALPFLESALAYYQDHESGSIILGDTLNGLGYIHKDLGNFGDSLFAYNAAAEVYRQRMNLDRQAIVLNNIGNLHVYLGEYVEAQLSLERALDILEKLPDDENYRVAVLNNLGWLYEQQYRYDEALSLYQTARAEQSGLDPSISFSRLLSNIAYVHAQKNELDTALTYYREALALTNKSPQLAERIEIFNGIGGVYFKQKNYEDVWVSHHRSLRLATQLNQPLSQARSWVELGRLSQTIEQPLLAIAFYKQAINQIEQVRAGLRSLPLETQQRYTDTIASSYRELAALLLEQGRVFEAQQVLDLLKIQELEDYFHDVRTDIPQVIETIPYLPPEQALLNQHYQLLLENRSDTDPVLGLQRFLRHPEIEKNLNSLQHSATTQLQPDALQQLQSKLQSIQPHRSAVLYPLILGDRLELLLVPPEGSPIHKTTAIDKATLTEQVTILRDYLTDPSSNVKKTASPLYDAIIRPFQRDLQRLEIDNIIYIPDGVLHYIPLSVLYDSQQKQWLVEQYTSHNLTASDIGDLTQMPSRPLNILAGAFADPNQTFQAMVDRTATDFNGLTYAGDEVSFLKEQLPNTQVLLDQDFSRSRLDAQLNGQNIVHLATHAAFVPGQPEDSFILLGNGDTITLKELQHWSLPNVEL
ncbi:MAG: tetratricopeptide repeat protein, partial [Cyanobacteria bacterium P01_F01_bin.116]